MVLINSLVLDSSGAVFQKYGGDFNAVTGGY